jgi:RNA polymerase sigma factor (sigma-70 family)
MDDRSEQIKKIVADFAGYIALKISEYGLSRYGISREDIFQDIYLKLWKSIIDGRTINHLPAYIRKTVNSVVINQIVSNNKNSKAIESQKREFKSVSCDIIGNRYSNPLHDILFESINKLKDSKKRVLKLFLLGYKVDDISKLQGWTVGKTNNLYYRAIKDLKKLLKEQGIYHED